MRIKINLGYEKLDLGVDGVKSYPFGILECEALADEINSINNKELLSAITKFINFTMQHLQ